LLKRRRVTRAFWAQQINYWALKEINELQYVAQNKTEE
jgi:hypothetical protein